MGPCIAITGKRCVLAILATAQLLALAACGAPEANDSESSDERPTTEVRTTVDEILNTYAANQVAGDQKFGDAKLVVSGQAVRVREAMGTGILVLGSAKSDQTLDLYFAEEGNKDLGKVQPGDQVEATCYAILEAMGSVTLSDCTTVS